MWGGVACDLPPHACPHPLHPCTPAPHPLHTGPSTHAQMGVTHMWGGMAYELSPHHEWARCRNIFNVLKKLVLFKKHRMWLVGVC